MAAIGVSLFTTRITHRKKRLVAGKFKVSSISVKQSTESKRKQVEKQSVTKETTTTTIPKAFDESEIEQLSVKDYLERAKEMIKSDGGPPRWFSPLECGARWNHSPLLLFLPGVDGIGLGLIMNHQRLGKIFDIWCLHIPVMDRTPFEDLVRLVERTVKSESSRSPNRPIYLVGESFGGCLALAVAARNPTADLMLILVNPATSLSKSQLRPLLPLLPVLEAMPEQLHVGFPYILGLVAGDPFRMMMATIEKGLPLQQTVVELSENLAATLPSLSVVADILPRESLPWKLQILKSAASFANSRIHAIKAETLILASGKDQLLPSLEEAERLYHLLPTCQIRKFNDSGHALLMEGGVDLVTIIKGAGFYRRTRKIDYVSDFMPPTPSEFKQVYDSWYRLVDIALSPVMLSTLDDGKIVRGLAGIPQKGPVVLVGYHMLLGLEIMGGVPVSPSNFYKLLSQNSHVLLYPGGVREALHRKGEEYKLFWPLQSEFVRMAARFGATIIPFGVIGEDDILNLIIDYDDFLKIPFVKSLIEEINDGRVRRLRDEINGEVAKEDIYFPGVLPKLPGRFYFLFGKPIDTQARTEELQDRERAHELYIHVKSEVERNIAYLKEKREKDPYRTFLSRLIYQAIHGSATEVPTFEV
ncbi:hypothetical protein AQUCO_10000006v1 [Aquilegia coerulea]|uniref:Serine aminopeptidase S33 domain-containing protein n=1 Tax=Aquilegia coerulea TaxID=218851 RepID=A0A2G5C449_AQUCA|nr:hypothetical protein AQUCO_10000006v1 [Aquilegia coerulea]